MTCLLEVRLSALHGLWKKFEIKQGLYAKMYALDYHQRVRF